MLAYIRTADGFLTAVHDLVPRSAKRHRVAVFNPGSNARQVSVLRLVNAGDEPAAVTVTGHDDHGMSPGAGVALTVPPGTSRSYTAAELESGAADGLQGALGDGAGKWRLTVTADRSIAVMSLLSSPTGHLANLSTAPGRGAGPPESAAEAFEALVSPVVQSKCAACHVEGGASGNTRLVFVTDEEAEHLTKNLSVFETFLSEVDDGAALILNKIQGVGHGGGLQVASDTDEYAAMESLLRLLGEQALPGSSVTVATLFDGVRMEPWRSTLRRAAIVFAGRIPTEAEYASIRGVSSDEFRTAVRALMQGSAFHEFLIRASNDRLLTDRDSWVLSSLHFVDFTNKHYRLLEAAMTSGKAEDHREVVDWHERVQYGAARAPLELIAHVVEADLPYTEILTADYIMANPWAAEAYAAPTEFEDSDDVHEFRPSEILGYYRMGETFVVEYHPVLGGARSRSRRLGYRLPARWHTEYEGLPSALPHDGHQSEPGAFSLDVLPLPRPRRGEVGTANHGPRRPRGHGQPDDGQPGVHGLPRGSRPGCRCVPELWRRGTVQT